MPLAELGAAAVDALVTQIESDAAADVELVRRRHPSSCVHRPDRRAAVVESAD